MAFQRRSTITPIFLLLSSVTVFLVLIQSCIDSGPVLGPITTVDESPFSQRIYGGSGYQVGLGITPGPDQSWIVTGFAQESATGGDPDIILMKVDSSGDSVWCTTFGTDDLTEIAYSVIQADDGTIIVAGRQSDADGESDMLVIAADASGDIIWSRSYGGSEPDRARSIIQCPESGFLIVGSTKSYGVGGYDIYLVKINDLGDTLWTRTFGGPEYDIGYDIAAVSGGGYVIAGYTESFGAGETDVVVIRTDAEGRLQWMHTYGGADFERAWAIVESPLDGCFWVAGHKDGTTHEYVLKIDPSGIGTTIDPGPSAYGSSLEDLAVNDRGAVIAVGSGITGDAANPIYLIQFDEDHWVARDWLTGPEGQTAGGNAIAANSRGQFALTGYSFINDGDILVSGVSAIGRLEE